MTNMAPNHPIQNPYASEEEQETSLENDDAAVEEENDVVMEEDGEEEEDESPVKRESDTEEEEEIDSEDTVPSPNLSDFKIKPVVRKSSGVSLENGSKRSAEMDPIETDSKKNKVMDTSNIILGLPIQDPNSRPRKKSASSNSGTRVKREVNAISKVVADDVKVKVDYAKFLLGVPNLDELWNVGRGNVMENLCWGMPDFLKDSSLEKIDSDKIMEKEKKLKQKGLELYIQRIDLVQEQAKQVLRHLESRGERN